MAPSPRVLCFGAFGGLLTVYHGVQPPQHDFFEPATLSTRLYNPSFVVAYSLLLVVLYMPSPPPGQHEAKRTALTLSASRLAVFHTYLSFAAFFSALFIGCALHYKKIVKNGVAGYPEEWFPSVSATCVSVFIAARRPCLQRIARIGDWYPERNIFQILIALNSGASFRYASRRALLTRGKGPRFAILLLQYYLQRDVSSALPKFLLSVGVVRTLSCGGWVFITSSDDHDWHDILMITYIVCNLPWMYGGISATRDATIRGRRYAAYRGTCLYELKQYWPLGNWWLTREAHAIACAKY